MLAQDYIRALRARRVVVERIREALDAVDVLAMPTVPIPAFRIDAAMDFEGTITLVRNTSPFNQSGTPAVSIPAATTSAGLPIGFQLAGHAFDDCRLLAVAEVVEALSAFDTTPPVLRGAGASAGAPVAGG